MLALASPAATTQMSKLTLLRAELIRGVAKPIGRDTFGGYAQRWVDGYGGRSGTRLYIQRVIDAMAVVIEFKFGDWQIE